MRRSLRKTHRFIWFSFVIALPLLLSIAWNMAPSASTDSDRHGINENVSSCPHVARYAIETELAIYKLENAQCSDNVQVKLTSIIRVPQLAAYVSIDSISGESLISATPVKFFRDKSYLEFEVPKMLLDHSFYILLADNLRRKPVEQVKMTAR